MSAQFDIVDIHTHLWPPAWGPGGTHEKSSFGFSAEIYRKITSPEALVEEFAAAGVDLAVVTTTIESLFGAEGPIDPVVVHEVNTWLAGLVASYPGQLSALATVDAFGGYEAAEYAERALDLGLSGLVIDSSRDGKFLAHASARPVLEVAARRGVPVFVHPVAHPQSDILIAGAGKLGNSLGRGLMNGVAFLSVLEAQLLDELPNLQLVFATLGLGAIVQAARGGKYGRAARSASERPNIYFDTMGSDPDIIRTLVGFFGADRVLAGTDWPILPALSEAALKRDLYAAGLSPSQQRLVAGSNARRLLDRTAVQALAAE